MKSLLKKFLPCFILNWYHKTLAFLAMFIYRNPSNKLIVIGVTGTNGKSTVVNLIGSILKEAKKKVGWTSTANFFLDDKEWLNDQKMTMLGRFKTQKFLVQAVKIGCHYAVIETSSEGIKQYRHLGINYDIAVFTNLTPEHIESHGSFENYKLAKGELFKHLTKKLKKKLNGRVIDKTIIVNADDPHADYFLSFKADKKLTYSINKPSNFQATDINLQSNGTTFKIQSSILNPQSSILKTNLYGRVNVYNYLAAIAVAKTLNIDEETIKRAMLKYHNMPGRFEFIETKKNLKVMVDYAPEPESMKRLYETLKIFSFNNIIHVLGSTGGGRDKARRPILGKLAAQNAQYVIVTNEDPYDDDPQEIIDQVAQGAIDAGKILNQNLYKILDRKEAIKKALSLAQENDLVLITGKGCEQFICVKNGKKIPWDDRKVVRELLK
jgi:UDP-N-acetylmuramoyl-L-alanyl-D-glutamate--2,6-diaminopimelate ligase